MRINQGVDVTVGDLAIGLASVSGDEAGLQIYDERSGTDQRLVGTAGDSLRIGGATVTSRTVGEDGEGFAEITVDDG